MPEWRDIIKQTQRVGLVQNSIFQKRVVCTKSCVEVLFTCLPSHQKVTCSSQSITQSFVGNEGYGEHIVYNVLKKLSE